MTKKEIDFLTKIKNCLKSVPPANSGLGARTASITGYVKASSDYAEAVNYATMALEGKLFVETYKVILKNDESIDEDEIKELIKYYSEQSNNNLLELEQFTKRRKKEMWS